MVYHGGQCLIMIDIMVYHVSSWSTMLHHVFVFFKSCFICYHPMLLYADLQNIVSRSARISSNCSRHFPPPWWTSADIAGN